MSKSITKEEFKIFAVLLILIAIIISTSTFTSSSTWDDSTYIYRQPITITNNADSALSEYQVELILNTTDLITEGKIQTDYDDIRFYNSTNSLLDYWIENSTEDNLTVWVKVPNIPASSTETIYMYYGNPSANSYSNINTTFSYNTPQEIYYVLSNWTKVSDLNISSYLDSNVIKDGTDTLNLNRQEVGVFNGVPINLNTTINITKPIAGRFTVDNNTDTVVPISWAGNYFSYSSSRYDLDTFCFRSPFGTANISIYDGNSANPDINFLVAKTDNTVCKSVTITNTNPAIVESSIPVVALYLTENAGLGVDVMPLYPMSEEIYGIVATSGATYDSWVIALNDSTTITIYCSSGNTTTITIDRGVRTWTGCTIGTQGTGNAMRVVSNKPIMANSQADADGTESMEFLPPEELMTEYILPTGAQYIAIATVYSKTNVTVYNPSGTFFNSTLSSGSATPYPQKMYLGSSTSGTGAAINFAAGTRISADKPFFMYYEYLVEDETNILSYKQARKYIYPEPTYSIGGEEFIPKPVLNFVSPTPANNTYTRDTNATINITIDSEESLDTFLFDWNSTNYTFYNPNDLVLMYNFNNVSSLGENGTYVVDMSKYSNNGTAEGGVIINSTGKYSGGAHFDGVNDYIDCGNDISLNLTRKITVEAWVKLGSGNTKTIISKTSSNTAQTTFWMDIRASDTQLFFGGYTNAGGVAYTYATFSFAQGVWYHLVGVDNGTNYNLYINGNRVTTAVSDTSLERMGGNWTAKVGVRGTTGSYFNGTIDEVRIWNRSLSADEINMSYKSNLEKFNSTRYIFYSNQTGLRDGAYPYFGWSNNTLVSQNQTELRTLTIDTIEPSIDFVTPTEVNYYNSSANSTYINVSVSDNLNTMAFIDWDNSLQLYYRFNESSGTTAYDFTNNHYDGTLLNGTNWTDAGKFSSGTEFNGEGNYIAINNMYYSQAGEINEIIVCAWAKSSSSNQQIIASFDRSEYWRLSLNDDQTTNVAWDTTDSSGTTHDLGTTSSYTDGNWHYICGWFQAGASPDKKLYIDGILVNSATAHSGRNLGSGDYTRYGFIGVGSEASSFDGGKSPVIWMNGTIDEVMIFNRSLTEEEINASYNNRDYPLYRNFSDLSDETYTYYAYAQDQTGNYNITETRNITTDTTLPSITITSPTANTVYNAVMLITTTITDTTTNVSYAYYNITNQTNDLVTTGNLNLTENWNATFNTSKVGDGNYTINVWANDTVNNINNQTVNFKIDNTNPTISWTLPNNDNSTYFALNGRLNIIFSDLNLFKTSINITNSSGQVYFNSTDDLNTSSQQYIDMLNLSDGAYTIEASVSDDHTRRDTDLQKAKKGETVLIFNSTSSEVTLTAYFVKKNDEPDSMPLDFVSSISELTDEGHYKFGYNFTVGRKGNKLKLNLSSTKNLFYREPKSGIRSHFVWDNYYIDYSDLPPNTNLTVMQIDNNNYIITIEGKEEWENNQLVEIDPVAGGLNIVTEYVTFTYDATAPNATLLFPPDNTINNTDQNFTINISENIGIKNATLRIYNESGDLINETTTSFAENLLQTTIGIIVNLIDGIYRWFYEMVDWAGNVFATGNYTITIDTTRSSINLVYPTDYLNTSIVNITFNYSVREINLDTCELYYNLSGNFILNQSTPFNTTQNFTINNIQDTTFFWNIRCNDSAGNVNWSARNYTVTIDATTPNINLISPANNSGDDDGVILFNYTVADYSYITSCSLIINNAINQTNTTITKGMTQSFTVNNLPTAGYNWSVNCTDSSNNLGFSETRIFSITPSTNFSGDTTDLSQVNISNITHLIIENPTNGKVNFLKDIDLSEGANLNSYVNISFNRIEINSNSLPALNKSARLTLYNLPYSDPRVLKDGAVCSDCTEVSYTRGTFVFDVTSFTVYSTEETPVTTGTTTPSGGGTTFSGGKAKEKEEKPQEFEVTPHSFNLNATIKELLYQEINVYNSNDVDLTITTDLVNLEDLVRFKEKTLTIKPKESKIVKFDVITPKEPGIYTGKIVLTAGKVVKEILVVLNVRSTEKSLFDISVDIPDEYKEIQAGNKLSTQITLIQAGLQEKTDVTLNYIIKDFEGKTYLKESETLAVFKQKSYKKEFQTQNLKSKDYIIGVEVIYPSGMATASSQFTVVGERFTTTDLLISVVFVAVIFVFITIIKLTQKYKKELKNIKKVRK